MSRESALVRGRTAAEAGMVDTCTIRRVTGGTTNPDTGYPLPVNPTVYAGKCRVQQRQATADKQDIGQDTVLLLRVEVQLPVAGSEGLKAGDEITITAAPRDADLPGRVFRIHDLAHKTDATARRVQCVEKTGS